MNEVAGTARGHRISNGMPSSVEKLCRSIWQIESEFNTLYRATGDFYPWPALRMAIYYRLAALSGVLEEVSWSPRLLRGKVLSAILRSGRTAGEIRSGPWLGNRADPCDLFIISNNPDIDHRSFAFAKPVAQEALDRGNTVVMVSDYCDDDFSHHAGFSRLSFESLNRRMILGYAMNLPRKWLVARLSKEDREYWRGVERAISKWIIPGFALVPMIERQLFLRSTLGPIYGACLDRFRPKEVATVCHYGQAKSIWIDEAHRRGILVSDIQHGTMSQFHLGYSFPGWAPGSPPIPYFPNKIRSWGSFWSSHTPIPLQPEAIEVHGWDMMRHRIAASRKRQPSRKANRVLMVSQAVISNAFQKFCRAVANTNPGFEFVFKPHPSEDLHSIQRNLSGVDNLEVAQDNDLYTAMEGSAFIVGVFSTAVYEACALGCRPLLVNLPGIEYMRAMIDAYGIPVLDDPNEFNAATERIKALDVTKMDLFGVESVS